MVAIVCGVGCGDLSGSLVVKLVRVALLGGLRRIRATSSSCPKESQRLFASDRGAPRQNDAHIDGVWGNMWKT
eukprot:11172384-Lingulodinium_polyedra.AAC.1